MELLHDLSPWAVLRCHIGRLLIEIFKFILEFFEQDEIDK